MTIFWYVLAINAVNLIDGMDGLAGSVVALSGTTLFLMGFVDDRFVSCLVLVAMLGGVTGFLRYNFNPASIFLVTRAAWVLDLFWPSLQFIPRKSLELCSPSLLLC